MQHTFSAHLHYRFRLRLGAAESSFVSEQEYDERYRDLACGRKGLVGAQPQYRAVSCGVGRGNLSARFVDSADNPGAHHQSDEELMADLKGNDSAALDSLFGRYWRLTLSVALRILRDRGEAEEVVQETFFYVFRHAKLFDPLKGSAKSWILQVGFHRALDRKAYLNRRGFYVGANIACLDSSLFVGSDLDQKIAARLDWAQLAKALEELSEMQQRTLDLFYFGGLDLREISKRLNLSIGNVRHHLYRGLGRLRKSAFAQKMRDKGACPD
jgi:RNA polymerase sigma-70 factor (ECF subfamily)